MPEERESDEGGLKAPLVGAHCLRDRLLGRARLALGAIEAARQRLDDLNVYPVPDGDTGTNLTLSVRAIVEAIERSAADDRAALAHEVSRAALMGARGNSGVILSQIVRGAAESLTGSDDLAAAFRRASDAAYAAVRAPAEGTMLTVIRELAEEAESGGDLDAILARGDDCVARTPEMLAVLREAGVVDAGAAGLVELVRGLAGRGAPPSSGHVSLASVHQELSRFRYCTSFVVEGDGLDAAAIERELDGLGDSLLVVGDASALRVHVHTDEPDRAVAVGSARGVVDALEVADMREQIAAREERLARNACAVVAVALGAGNRRLFGSLGASVVDGSTSPSPRDFLAAIEAGDALEVVLLPNDPNAVLAAEHAAGHASKPARVLPTRTMQAGLAALVAFDAGRPAAENLEQMHAAAEAVATGAVYENGGTWIGLVDGAPAVEGPVFDDVAAAIAERLLGEPRSILTLLTGDSPPPLDGLLARLAEANPGLEVEVQDGGQRPYALLLGAE